MTSPEKKEEGRKWAALPPIFSPLATNNSCHSDEERGGISFKCQRLIIFEKQENNLNTNLL